MDLLIEFEGDRLTGRAAQALLDLVDQEIIALYDVLVVGKQADGSTYALDLADGSDQLGGCTDLAWVRSGLLTEDDMREAAGAMQPGTLAVLIVYENAWAVPFAAAAAESGEQLKTLADLKAQGVLTDAEFAAQKARILAG